MNVDSELITICYELFFGRKPEDTATIEHHIGELKDKTSSEIRRYFLNSAEYLEIHSSADQECPLKDYANVYHPDLAKFFAPAGTASNDRTAIVGRDGYCFIYEGGNKYYDSYSDSLNDTTLDSWKEFILGCQTHLLGSNFLFLLVPNKATCIPEKFPLSLANSSSALFSELRKIQGVVVPILDVQQEFRGDCWSRVDSHLSIEGNFRAATSILGYFGMKVAASFDYASEPILKSGDLGSKFNPPLFEIGKAPIFLTEAKISQVSNNLDTIPLGHFKGTRVHLRNAASGAAGVLYVVGNSFCNTGYPGSLLWFLACSFRDTFFLWDNEVDFVELRRVKPNYIVFQTVERFLPRPPTIKY